MFRFQWPPAEIIAKDCLLTGQEQACTRITWLFGCLFVIVCHHAENGWIRRKIAVDCTLMIKSWPDPNSLLHRSTLVLFIRLLLSQFSYMESWTPNQVIFWVLFSKIYFPAKSSFEVSWSISSASCDMPYAIKLNCNTKPEHCLTRKNLRTVIG